MVQIQFSTALIIVNIALMFMGVAIIVMLSGTRIMSKRSTAILVLICILFVDFVGIINIMPTNELGIVTYESSGSESGGAEDSADGGGKASASNSSDNGELRMRYYKDIGNIRIIRDRYVEPSDK